MNKVTFLPMSVAEAIHTPSVVISIRHVGEEPGFRVDHIDVLELPYNQVGDPMVDVPEKVLEFLDKHPNTDVIVHCTYGESRSAAIAKWMADARGYVLDTKYPGCRGSTGGYSHGLYQLLSLRDLGHVAANSHV